MAESDFNLLFIISLPRSGSTLLQRVLMSHANISSISEPWLLLPLVYLLKPGEVKASYGHSTAHLGITNLVSHLEGGVDTFYKEVGKFVESLYRKMSKPGARYFLDKTPRYYLIVNELITIFPEAKYIVLVRNPISILASYIVAMKRGTLQRLDQADYDLYLGPKCISNAYHLLRDRCLLVRYEDFVVDPEKEISSIYGYLGLDIATDTLCEFYKQEIVYGLGDHKGVTYRSIVDDLDKWKGVINTWSRLRFTRKYIKMFDDGYLRIGHYSRETLMAELDSVRVKGVGFWDAIYLVQSYLFRRVKRALGWRSVW